MRVNSAGRRRFTIIHNHEKFHLLATLMFCIMLLAFLSVLLIRMSCNRQLKIFSENIRPNIVGSRLPEHNLRIYSKGSVCDSPA